MPTLRLPHPDRLLAGAALLGALSCSRPGPEPPREAPPPSLAALISTLSEPAGTFDTDNLISNESDYLQVADHLEAEAPKGGAYLGVGPEQNYSYIARVRPRWAFVVDIRRGNLLQHLVYHAILDSARDPFEYLCRLLSRPIPPARPPQDLGSIERTLRAVEEVPPRVETLEANLRAIERHITSRLHVSLSEEDRRAIRSIATAFFKEQLELRFETHGQGVRLYHPTYRSLLLARSPSGRYGCFLGSMEDYRFVRELAREGRLVPVVGDFAGGHALRAIGAFLAERGTAVSAFYVSNVEFYLMRQGGFDAFAANVGALPVRPDSLLIRAVFHYGAPHPARIPGHRSATLLQRIPRFLQLHAAGAYASYWDVARLDYLR
jgi:hypothetical protein